MTRRLAVLLAALGTCCAFAAPLRAETESSPEACLDAARAEAAAEYARTKAPVTARRKLEIRAAKCLDPTLSDAAAGAVGALNADRARLAHQFVTGKLTLTAWRAARRDRVRKATEVLSDPKAQQALLAGDADGDFVPDALDRCAKTAPDVPTDARGCPIPVRPGTDDEADERRLRATLGGSRTLLNPSCADAPPPARPSPVQWGRGSQTRFGTQGFNFAVAKVGGQPQGCEVFYEMQLRFIDQNPGNPALPPAKIVTITFSQKEDLLNDANRAVFGVPVGNMTLSAGRGIAREAMLREYFRITWRVRAVNGANQTSPWSAFVTQGPAGTGVDG